MKKLLFSLSLLGTFYFVNAQVDTIDEDFEGATENQSINTTPYNGWTSNVSYPKAYIGKNGNTNMRLIAYSFMDRGPFVSTDPVYLVGPELNSAEGTLSFNVEIAAGPSGNGTMYVGTISSPTDYASFEPISTYNTISVQDVTLEIDDTSHKFIAFKFIPSGTHQAGIIDNVKFKPKSTASTNEINGKIAPKFAVDNGNLVFSNDNIKTVKIFSANGSLVATEKVSQKRANISKLSTGIYFLIIEDNSGNITKSKFIKK